MATDKTKGIIAVVAGVLVLAIGTFLLVVGIKSRNETAFEFVKRKGGQPTALNGLTFGGYTFYTNNRTFRVSDNKKGTYNKTEIVFDDGTKVQMSDIFK